MTVVPALACGTPDSSLSADERRLTASSIDSATRGFEDAQRALDAERVIAHLAPDFSMYGDGVRSTRDSVVAGMRRSFVTYRHLEPGFTDIRVSVLGRDAALASFHFRDSIVTMTGETLKFQGATTLLWERRERGWQISYAHADHRPVP